MGLYNLFKELLISAQIYAGFILACVRTQTTHENKTEFSPQLFYMHCKSYALVRRCVRVLSLPVFVQPSHMAIKRIPQHNKCFVFAVEMCI